MRHGRVPGHPRGQRVYSVKGLPRGRSPVRACHHAAARGAGWSQSGLARQAGIAQPLVSLIESGARTNRTAAILQALACAGRHDG